MRSVLALVAALLVVLSAAAPHHHGGAFGNQECAACLAGGAEAAHHETPDLAPVALVATDPASPTLDVPSSGAPLGAIPGQSPPAV